MRWCGRGHDALWFRDDSFYNNDDHQKTYSGSNLKCPMNSSEWHVALCRASVEDHVHVIRRQIMGTPMEN